MASAQHLWKEALKVGINAVSVEYLSRWGVEKKLSVYSNMLNLTYVSTAAAGFELTIRDYKTDAITVQL